MTRVSAEIEPKENKLVFYTRVAPNPNPENSAMACAWYASVVVDDRQLTNGTGDAFNESEATQNAIAFIQMAIKMYRLFDIVTINQGSK